MTQPLMLFQTGANIHRRAGQIMARPKRIYGLGHPRGGVKAPTEFKSEVRHSAEPLRLKVLVGDSLPALESGRSGAAVAWRNPDSGRYGSIVPGPAYQSNGLQCRPYTHTI